MENKHKERKAYMAPTVEFHAVVPDIIMCSGNQPGNGGQTGNNNHNHNGGWGWHWWPWG